jgi:hypothetical protein
MNLSDYIKQTGAKDFAAQFGVTERAALAWQYKTRIPRTEMAKRIVAETPVTWAGINGQEAQSEQPQSA